CPYSTLFRSSGDSGPVEGHDAACVGWPEFCAEADVAAVVVLRSPCDRWCRSGALQPAAGGLSAGSAGNYNVARGESPARPHVAGQAADTPYNKHNIGVGSLCSKQ